ncbi:LuxR C-terminal-related transcriptional regulator [Microcoleus sp. Pol14C2]|uniref:LuxR C-terminal-related transcriptional regulator n=1 Tax=unclassified Microcoleus TaxID=2642155 RepID=UPI002FD3823E
MSYQTQRFLVIEDHPEVGQNNCDFLRMIDPQCSCIIQETPEEGIEQLKQENIDLVVVDLQFGTLTGEESAKPGLALLNHIFEHHPLLNVLVYTSEPSYLRQVVKQIFEHQGGFAVVNKMERRNAFLEGGRNALTGQCKIPRNLMNEMPLTDKDRTVLDLLCNQALTDQAIADRMHISLKTAQNYVQSLKAKLNVDQLDGQLTNTRIAVCMEAIKRRLIG